MLIKCNGRDATRQNGRPERVTDEIITRTYVCVKGNLFRLTYERMFGKIWI